MYIRVIVSHVFQPPVRMSVLYCTMLLNNQYVYPCNSVPCCSTTNTYVRVILSHVVQPPVRMSVYYCPMLFNHQYVCSCTTVPCCSTTNTYVRVILSHVVQPPMCMRVCCSGHRGVNLVTCCGSWQWRTPPLFPWATAPTTP